VDMHLYGGEAWSGGVSRGYATPARLRRRAARNRDVFGDSGSRQRTARPCRRRRAGDDHDPLTHARRSAVIHAASARYRADHCNEKLTTTVTMTATATLFSSAGVYSHWRTASSAAWSSGGAECAPLASRPLPSTPTVASMITAPCVRADAPPVGYTGLTSLI